MFNPSVTRVSFALLICAATIGCTRSERAQEDESPASTAEGARSADARDAVRRRGALLLDVRTRQEFEAERVDGAHNIPAGEIGARLSEIVELAGGLDKPVVVYCSSLACSAFAKTELARHGFQNVISAGTLRDWPIRSELRRGGAR